MTDETTPRRYFCEPCGGEHTDRFYPCKAIDPEERERRRLTWLASLPADHPMRRPALDPAEPLALRSALDAVTRERDEARGAFAAMSEQWRSLTAAAHERDRALAVLRAAAPPPVSTARDSTAKAMTCAASSAERAGPDQTSMPAGGTVPVRERTDRPPDPPRFPGSPPRLGPTFAVQWFGNAWTYHDLHDRYGARFVMLGNPDLLYFCPKGGGSLDGAIVVRHGWWIRDEGEGPFVSIDSPRIPTSQPGATPADATPVHNPSNEEK